VIEKGKHGDENKLFCNEFHSGLSSFFSQLCLSITNYKKLIINLVTKGCNQREKKFDYHNKKEKKFTALIHSEM